VDTGCQLQRHCERAGWLPPGCRAFFTMSLDCGLVDGYGMRLPKLHRMVAPLRLSASKAMMD
jgi:hypothetical protein